MKVVWIVVIFIIPFFGALVYIVTRPKMTEQDKEIMAGMQAQQRGAFGYSSADEVAKLAALRDSGAITPRSSRRRRRRPWPDPPGAHGALTADAVAAGPGDGACEPCPGYP